MVTTIGKPILKPSEAVGLTPAQLERVQVVGDSRDLLPTVSIRDEEIFGDLTIRQQDAFRAKQLQLKQEEERKQRVVEAKKVADERARKAAAAKVELIKKLKIEEARKAAQIKAKGAIKLFLEKAQEREKTKSSKTSFKVDRTKGVKVYNNPTTASSLRIDGKLVYSENPFVQFDSKYFKGYLPRGKTPKQVKLIDIKYGEETKQDKEIKDEFVTIDIIGGGGGIRSQGHKYFGTAVVPGTGGKTANQIRDEFKASLRKQGLNTNIINRASGTVNIMTERTFNDSVRKIQSNLPEGEELIIDTKNREIKGIKSAELGQFIQWTDQGIKFYNTRLEQLQPAIQAAAPTIKEQAKSIIKGYSKFLLFQQGKNILPATFTRVKSGLNPLEYKKARLIRRGKLMGDKDIIALEKFTGATLGIFGQKIPGAVVWAIGDISEGISKRTKDGGKISKKEAWDIFWKSAGKGAIMGISFKLLGRAGSLTSKRLLTGAAIKSIESVAGRAAINHGGQIIKVVSKAGQNLIATYFYKDIIGNVFDVTKELTQGNFNNALRRAIETGGSIGGYIGGSKLGDAITKGALLASGKLKATTPEFVQKKTQLDVMAKQLLSKGKIVLTRRGVYETGKGLSPRKDAWLDSSIKNPTKSIFWRFDKTLSKTDQAISPLPLFTKSKSGYWTMFKANWKKNRGLGLVKRYLKTTAETPSITDVLIRQVVNLKDIKNLALRKQVIKEYATTGKLSKKTQALVLKNKFPISDKNREFGFHDENEFVTRTGFKLKGRKDISWTFDPVIGEFIPVVQSLKDTGRIKNFLSVLNRKKIITRTDAKLIADNFAIKTKFKSKSILPKGHSYDHMKNVERNIVKIMDKYPEFNKYWIKKYGSVSKAKDAMKKAMWHDIGKTTESSVEFGTPHGEKVWRVWKAKLLPKSLKIKKGVAKAIRVHETLDPRKLSFKIKNRVKLITPEAKVVATADRLDLARYNIKIDPKRLPLPDVIKRLKLKVSYIKYPKRFNAIINRIKIDKRVTKKDIKALLSYIKKAPKKIIKKIKVKVKKRKIKKKKIKLKRKKAKAKRRSVKKKKRLIRGKPKKRKAARGRPKPKRRIKIRKKPRARPKARGRPKPRKITKPTKRPPTRITRKVGRPPKRPPKRPGVRPPTKRPPTPPKRPPAKLILPKVKTKKLKKAVMTYKVLIKKRGKFVRVKTPPLRLNDSRDVLAYQVDKSLARTAKIVPIGKGKTIGVLTKSVKGYFLRKRKKLRSFKIRKGVKKRLTKGYIEKKKYVGDTRSEQRQLQIARAKKRPVKKKKPKKRVLKKIKKSLKKKKSTKKKLKKKRTKKKTFKNKKRLVKRTKKRVVKRKSSQKIKKLKRAKVKKKKPVKRTLKKRKSQKKKSKKRVLKKKSVKRKKSLKKKKASRTKKKKKK